MERDHLYGRMLGDFVVQERIGTGGNGVVYRAVQQRLNRNVVIKILRDTRALDEVAIDRFVREARLASRLDGRYTAQVLDTNHEEDGLLWIAMELVQGVTLAAWLDAHGPMPFDQFAPFFVDLAEGVAHAHAHGIVHRDIKPENIMVLEDNGRLFPRLLDFGIAKPLEDCCTSLLPHEPLHHHATTREDRVPRAEGSPTNQDPSAGNPPLTGNHDGVGSLPYMAPEQWDSACSVDQAADVYSLGIVGHEALIGNVPFDGNAQELRRQHMEEPPPVLGDDFPVRLEVAIKGALAKDPADRPSARELAEQVSAAWRSAPQEQLRAAAQQWKDRNHSSGLLWGPEDVADVKRTVPTHTMGQLECSFVAASDRRARIRAWWRRALVVAIVVIIGGGAIAGFIVRSTMQARLERERTRLAEQEASAQRAIADARITESQREQGRAALLHNEPEAFAHLFEAYRRDPTPLTAFMLARAAEPRLAEKARFPSTYGRMWWTTFSPDGSQIATADDRAARIWDAETYKHLFTLPHGSEVYQVFYSADGTKIVTIAQAMVRVWDAHDGTLLHDLRPVHHQTPQDFYRGAISADGHWVAAIDASGSSTCVWDLEHSAIAAELHTRGAAFPALSFSAGGWLATTGGEEVRIFDVRGWAQVRSIGGHNRSLAFDATGRLVTGSMTGEIALWNVQSGVRIRQLRPFGESVDTVAFSPDGALVASGSRDGMMQVWRVDSGAQLSGLNPRHRKILYVEFDSVAGSFLGAHADGTVVVADVAQGLVIATLEGPTNIVGVARFGTGSRVVGASWDGTARVWGATSPYRHWSAAPAGTACTVGWGARPDMRFVAVGCRNDPTRVWDTSSDQLLAELPTSTPIDVEGFISASPAVTAAGDVAAVARGTSVAVYEVPGGRLLHTVEHSSPVSAIAFADSGHAMVSGALDGSVRVVRDAREAGAQFAVQVSGGVSAVAFLPDGRIAVADAEHHLRLFADGLVQSDLALPLSVASLRRHGDRIVALPGEAGPPLLIDLASPSPRVVALLEGHVGRVFSARWVGDERILTAGADGTARLWDGKTGALLQTYMGGRRYLGDAVLYSDMVVGGDADGLLQFWDARSGVRLWTLPVHKSAVLGIHLEGANVITRGLTGELGRLQVPQSVAVIDECVRSPSCAIVR